jgi:NAD(P)-dependent dehydrogenase (short-subunit alcohol dehydrogenase family)
MRPAAGREEAMGFEGRRALVTGAGKGIGRELVRALRERGAEVVALSRAQADLDSLRTETGCETIQADLDDTEAAAARVRAALPVHLLVNNAGISRLAPALETTEADFFAVLRVNAWAALRVAQVVAGDLVARGEQGAIVNVSSVAAGMGLADHAAYCASKAALDAITRVLAVEWGGHGIRTNSVNPTVTLTPMAEMAWSDPAKAGPMQARIPMRRFVRPREVADAVCFLLGDGAAMVNGACLDVDGGLRAG